MLLDSLVTILLLSHFLSCLWLRINAFEILDVAKDYITAAYFIITTASTVGYGDVSVDHKETRSIAGRYIFAILIQIASLIFFAYIQSLISSLLKQFRASKALTASESQEFEEWMTVRNQTQGVIIPYNFEKILYEYFFYMNNFDLFSAVNRNGFIDLISIKIKEDILHNATQYIISSFSFFDGMHDGLAQGLIYLFSPVSFVSGDKICSRGEKSKGIYLVLKGTVLATYKQVDFVVERVDEKEYFGDFCFLEKTRSHFDFVAQGNLVCLFAEKTKIVEILHGSKKENELVTKVAKLRLKYMLYLKKQVEQSKAAHSKLKTGPAEANKLEFNTLDIVNRHPGDHPNQYLETENKELMAEEEDWVIDSDGGGHLLTPSASGKKPTRSLLHAKKKSTIKEHEESEESSTENKGDGFQPAGRVPAEASRKKGILKAKAMAQSLASHRQPKSIVSLMKDTSKAEFERVPQENLLQADYAGAEHEPHGAPDAIEDSELRRVRSIWHTKGHKRQNNMFKLVNRINVEMDQDEDNSLEDAQQAVRFGDSGRGRGEGPVRRIADRRSAAGRGAAGRQRDGRQHRDGRPHCFDGAHRPRLLAPPLAADGAGSLHGDAAQVRAREEQNRLLPRTRFR
jgi:CRP-like cAMP-binding protein